MFYLGQRYKMYGDFQKNILLFLSSTFLFFEWSSALNVVMDYYMQPNNLGSCGSTISGKESAFIRSHVGAHQLGALAIKYPNNIATCSLAFDAGSGRNVLIKFLEFELQDKVNNLCVDYLSLYDTSNGLSPYLKKCGTAAINPFLSSGRNITLEFVTNGDTVFKGFKLLLTSFRYASNNCTVSEFRCDATSCVDKDLRCDGASHCIDGSDEDRTKAGCSLFEQIVAFVTGLGAHTVLAIVILAGGIVLTLFTTIIVYQLFCKKNAVGAANSDTDHSARSKPGTSAKASPRKAPRNVVMVAQAPKKSTAWNKKSTKPADDDCDF